MRRLLLILTLLPAFAFAGGFGGAISSSGPATSVSTPATPPLTLVGVGDSIMNWYGVPSPLDTAVLALGPSAIRYNAGVPGENSAQIKDRWLASEATVCGVSRCTHVWFEGGVNDLRLTATLPPAIISNMETAVDDALAKGYTVVWSDILPCRGDAQCTEAVAANILTYNGLMSTACATAPRSLNPRLRCIFAYATFNNPANPGFLLPAYSSDNLHLTPEGSALLGSLAAAVLP